VCFVNGYHVHIALRSSTVLHSTTQSAARVAALSSLGGISIFSIDATQWLSD